MNTLYKYMAIATGLILTSGIPFKAKAQSRFTYDLSVNIGQTLSGFDMYGFNGFKPGPEIGFSYQFNNRISVRTAINSRNSGVKTNSGYVICCFGPGYSGPFEYTTIEKYKDLLILPQYKLRKGQWFNFLVEGGPGITLYTQKTNGTYWDGTSGKNQYATVALCTSFGLRQEYKITSNLSLQTTERATSYFADAQNVNASFIFGLVYHPL
ncbi:MAG: hypothetical protein GC181_12155 [Bacteroidetes bacterium]|nr:hypothetical protein [Bacteroidota bacterium]